MKHTTGFKFDITTATVDDIWKKELEVSNRIESGEIHFSAAKEITNAMGKALKVVAAKLEYAKLRKEIPNIPQLATNKQPKP
jgi:hypothetical protein